VNDHPTDAELREFVGHSLAADRLIALDDHLAGCELCRSRAARLGNAAAHVVELRTDVLALESHLTEQELDRLATGTLTPDDRRCGERHLAECASCASEAADRRRWAASPSRRPSHLYLAAAAAIVVLVLVPFAVSRWSADDQPAVQVSLAGLDQLPAEQVANVRAALSAGVAEPPAWIVNANRQQTLMGTPTVETSFELTAPIRTATLSDRPEFRWTPLPGADAYTLAVLDTNLAEVIAPVKVTRPAWTPPQPFARGVAYVWQVTAHRGRDSVTVPAPPAPMAGFRVVDQAAADAIERVTRTRPRAHVLLGILLAQAGALPEAEAHLQQVEATDPHAGVARRTLERLQSVR
jgi:hypothetical protein